MGKFLYPSDDDYLDTEEVASRLVRAFPTTLVDWAAGDEEVERSLQALIGKGAPEVVLASHRAMAGRTAYVRVCFPEFPGKCVRFLLWPFSRLELQCSDSCCREFLNHAAARMAAALQYEVGSNE